MNKKELQDLGIEDEELIQKIIIAHGKDIEKHKDEITTLTTKVTELDGQLTSAQEAMAKFKDMNVEEIQASVEEWKGKYEEAQAESEKKVAALKFDHALDDALRSAGARNLKAVKALLDVEKITFDEKDQLTGLDEQIDNLLEEQDYLFDFEDDEEEPEIITKTDSKVTVSDSMVSAARKASGLPES